ncbi:hypothetical protein JCM9279_006623 [Rhodotorula babjevae]
MSTAKVTTAPAATPSSPGGSSSTTSWPATEVAVSEPGDSATATPSSPVDSPPPLPDHAAARSLEASPAEDDSPGDGGDRKLKTPASPTWSRSKLPVSDDERDAGGDRSLDSNTGDVADEEHKQSIDAVEQSDSSTPARPGAARPAFVVTRPTAMGENEVVSVTQPSTPSASVHEDDEPVADPALKAVEIALKPASTDSSLKPIIQITTFLPETQSFVASPASANLPSAISPRTSAFFSSDFSMSGPRSPPRPGGAIIMELPSDVELDVDIEVRRATRTVVSSTNEPASASLPPALPQRTSPATSTKHRSRSRSPQPPSRPVDKRSTSSRDRRSRSHRRRGANLSDADSSASEPDAAAAAARAPFLPRRTVVSSAAPFLSRTESLAEQARRREQDEGREREREAVRARHEAPRDEREDHRLEIKREERRRDERGAARRDHHVEPARREHALAHEPGAARRPEPARRQDGPAHRSRHRDVAEHDLHRRDVRPAEQPRKPALARLLDAVQEALDHDPAAYYALKGLLAEHEYAHERPGAQRERVREPDDAKGGERRRERDGHERRDGLEREKQRSHERERREKRIPVDLLGRGERDSGSETEVGFEKVKRGGGLKSSRFDAPPADKLRTGRFFSTDPPRRDSPSPPSYPSHLSPQRTSRTPIPAPQAEGVRPRDDSARRAQTLTLAQAAKLAAGLGDERLAEELRSSGLSGRDKVTKLGERVEDSRRAHEHGERERRRDEDRSSGKVKGGKASRKGGVDEELKLRRRQGDERDESSSSSPHGPSAKDALRSSIFKVRPPIVVDDDVPVAAGAGSGKASRRRRDRDEPYRSPTTGSAARAASHFDLPTRSTGGGTLSWDFYDCV